MMNSKDGDLSKDGSEFELDRSMKEEDDEESSYYNDINQDKGFSY